MALGPHPLKERHAVNKLMLQCTQNVQSDQNDQRGGKKFVSIVRDLGERCVFADGQISCEETKKVHRRRFAIGTDHEPASQWHENNNNLEKNMDGAPCRSLQAGQLTRQRWRTMAKSP